LNKAGYFSYIFSTSGCSFSIERIVSYHPFSGDTRVIVIDPADLMTEGVRELLESGLDDDPARDRVDVQSGDAGLHRAAGLLDGGLGVGQRGDGLAGDLLDELARAIGAGRAFAAGLVLGFQVPRPITPSAVGPNLSR
jgi:hypothetical protein